MEWKPNRLIAVLLGLFAQPIAMLYLGRTGLALAYFIVPLAIVTTEFVLAAPWLSVASLSALVAIVCAIHAYRIAAGAMPVVNRPWYSRRSGLVLITLLSLSVVYLLRAFFYEPFRMPSASMYPTIKVGDHLLVKKYGYGQYASFGIPLWKGELHAEVRRGDLIVFEYPPEPSISFVKRVIGIPGDTLQYDGRELVVNGKTVLADEVAEGEYPETYMGVGYEYLKESLEGSGYMVAYTKGRMSAPFEVRVPDHSYFMLGDNRNNSKDSRYWGFVDKQLIIGKVIYISGDWQQ